MRFNSDVAFWAHWAKWPIAGAGGGIQLPPSGGGSTGGPTGTPGNLLDLQKLAYDFNINPFEPSDELDAIKEIIALATQLGRDPKDLKFIFDLKDKGLITPTTAQKLLFGDGSGEAGSGGTRLSTDDPRYWELAYAELDQKERQSIRETEAGLRNSGLDADSARQQALASLIQSRNINQINLASTYGDIAAQAAQFSANPRDAVADLNFRNAVGGATPYGAAQSQAQFPELQSKLNDKFQELFGGAANTLSRAQEFLLAPPPAEFFGAETRQQLGLQPTAAQGLASGGTGAVASPTPTAPAPNPLQQLSDALGGAGLRTGGLTGDLTPKGEDFIKWVTAANGGVQPTTAEDGVNMNIMEPAAMVGQSGRVYFTVAETDPEEVIVKKLPSTKEREKKEKDAAKKFTQQTSGATRMAQGGSAAVMPDASTFINELRKQLGSLGGAGGGTGGFGTALPDIRLLAGAPANALAEDPDLMNYAKAGFSSMGISDDTFLSTLRKFTPNAPVNNSPRVNWL